MRSSSGWLNAAMGNYSVAAMVDRYARLETWTNGTKGYFSMCARGQGLHGSDLWVNCTAWLPENKTILQTSNFSSMSVQPLSEGNLPKIYRDGNVTFIYGRNSTCFTTYEHDDNYETYYPLQWNTHYELQGQTKIHQHLTTKLLNQWMWNNITTAYVMALAVAGYHCFHEYIAFKIDPLDLPKSIAEEIVVAAVAYFWGVPAAIAAVVIILLAEIFMQIIQYVQTVYWINFVVREWFGGDGWRWKEPDEFRYCCKLWDAYFWKPATIYNWHRVCFFNLAWGVEGVFGIPQLYGIDLGLDHQTRSPDYAHARWR
ncbi:hypothetical protein KEJ15_00250 [Candidatus Bathyarchaeota archaeon]|nr:hypothetical protein [Candidatus Bathyarchaeota archaeon]